MFLCRLVERFLQNDYKPHQLSTYALTLYKHTYRSPDGTDIAVGTTMFGRSLMRTIRVLQLLVVAAQPVTATHTPDSCDMSVGNNVSTPTLVPKAALYPYTHADIWDTAGQERFNSMHASYYYRAHACIMVFDVTRKITYKNLENWYHELQQHAKGIPTILVANKIDIDYQVCHMTCSSSCPKLQ